MVFAHKHCEGKVPLSKNLHEIDEKFLAKIHSLLIEIEKAYETYRLRHASQLLMQLCQEANTYFDSKRPWVSAKNAETKQDMLNTISCCLEAIKLIALASFPIIPTTAEAVFETLGHKGLAQKHWDHLTRTPNNPGHSLGEPRILFRKVEDEEIEAELKKLLSK